MAGGYHDHLQLDARNLCDTTFLSALRKAVFFRAGSSGRLVGAERSSLAQAVAAPERKMNRPKVLVLLAAFNGSKWILEQAESILNQINVEIHLIISDDGSTDGTRAMIERLATDQRVRTISPPVPTGSAAQNFLWLIRSTPVDGYDFISFADQDDIWYADKIYRGCCALSKTAAKGYSSAVTAFWSDGRERTLAQVETLTSSDYMFEGAGQGSTFVLAGAFYSRLRAFLLEHTSQTKLLHYHDWAIYALSRSWKINWIFDHKPCLRYRQHGENDTGARTTLGGIGRRLGRIKNGWYLEQLRVIADICFAASPSDPVIAEWHELLARPRGFVRAWHIAGFCLRGGRRRLSDRVILLSAVIAGWI
jgi:rhamnosyltransferase